MQTKLDIITQSKTSYVKQGAAISVTVKAADDGLAYLWYVKNAGATKWTKYSITTSTYSAKISATTNGRQGYCVVTDQYGNTVKTSTATLKMS